MENFTERKTPAGCTAPGLSMTTAASALWWTSRGARATKPLTTRCRSWNIWTRAGKDAEGKTGDGVGILTQISDKFFQKAAAEQGLTLGAEREYGIGMFFFPQDELKRNQAKKLFEIVCKRRVFPS